MVKSGLGLSELLLIWYNDNKKFPESMLNRSREGLAMMTTDMLWKVFEATGSIAAYLLYRRLLLQ